MRIVAFESLGMVSYLHSIETILYHFQDKVWYSPKIAIFYSAIAFDTPLEGPGHTAIPFDMEKNRIV